MPDRRRVPRGTLPDQRTLLSWLFVGRLVLAIGILLGAGLVWTERPQESFLVTVAVIVALLFTGYGAWLVFLRGRRLMASSRRSAAGRSIAVSRCTSRTGRRARV